MRHKSLAEITSRVLGMHTWFPVILVVALLRTGLTIQQIKILFPSLLFLQVLLPILFLYFIVKHGRVSSWDLPKREERHHFLLFILLCSLVSIVLVYFFGSILLFRLSLSGLILVMLAIAITRFWKISLHASLNTAAAIVVNFLFNWELPFLYLLIPIVVWARYTLGRHTMGELMGGLLLSAGFVLGAFKLLRYI